MPDRRLTELQDAVRTVVEPVAIEQRVPFTRIAARAVRRRRRRRAAVLAAVAVLAAGGLLLTRPGADRPPPPVTLEPTPRHGPALLVQSLAFGTSGHGFATVQRCAGPGYRCAAHAMLLRTDDGARTWTRVPSPADNGPAEDASVVLATETGGVVLWVGSIWYASPDGGQHWAAMPRKSPRGPATAAAPAGWTLGLDSSGRRVAAFDPLTNEQRPLVNQPVLPGTPGIGWAQETAGHRIVLAHITGPATTMVYTGDRGRTWHALPAPPSKPGAVNWLLGDQATERVYLAAGDDQLRVLQVWRLDRVGAEWVRVPVPPEVAADQNSGLTGTMKALRVLPDGELAYLLSPPLRTEDGGTRTVPLPAVDVYGTAATLKDLGVSAGGTLYQALPTGISAPDGTLAVLVSTDSGRTWTVRVSRP
jgi:hypothetical protein